MAIDMETATIFITGFHNEIPTGALLLVSDQPMVPEGVKTAASDEVVTCEIHGAASAHRDRFPERADQSRPDGEAPAVLGHCAAGWEEVLASLKAPVIRYKALLELKRSADRPQDLADIANLAEVRKLRKERGS